MGDVHVATVQVNLNTGDFIQEKPGDFPKAVYSNSRGAQKNFTWLSSLTTVASDLFNCVPQSMMDAMGTLGRVSLLAAPLCGMHEAVTFAIDAARKYVQLSADFTMKTASKAFGYTMKTAQRVSEAAAGIMKLGWMDATYMVGARFFKDGFACIVDVIGISEAVEKDQEIAKIAHKELREAAELTNHFSFFKGWVGLTFHAMNLTALLCSEVVTFYMVTVLASLFVFTVLGTVYTGMQEDDLRNKLGHEIATGKIQPLAKKA